VTGTGPFVLRGSLEPVLGTRLTMRVSAADEPAALTARAGAEATADRLEAILSAYRAGSPFDRWRGGLLDQPPAELVDVLAAAAHWQDRTGGAFNPCLGAVVGAWRAAERDQRLPPADELAGLARAAAHRPFDVLGGEVRRTGDCSVVDVHGVAKGWVVDRMAEAAIASPGVEGVLVDLGGDVRHASPDAGTVTVAVEDPFRVADNARALTVLRLGEAAVASSGGGRRGWRIAGQWYGHLLDPSTGWPLPHQRAATVVAPTAADADAAASAAAVLVPERLAEWADADRIAVLTVSPGGEVWRSATWSAVVDEA